MLTNKNPFILHPQGCEPRVFDLENGGVFSCVRKVRKMEKTFFTLGITLNNLFIFIDIYHQVIVVYHY